MIPTEINGMKVIEYSPKGDYGLSKNEKGKIAYYIICNKGKKVFLLECADDFTILHKKSWQSITDCHMIVDGYVQNIHWEKI